MLSFEHFLLKCISESIVFFSVTRWYIQCVFLCTVAHSCPSDIKCELLHHSLVTREEHKSHSPSCHFIALKKKVEDLTVEEFLRLQKERHKFIIVCFS